MGMVWSARTANERQLQELRANSEVIPNFLNEISEYQNGNVIGLDKQWHADHYLLTGSAGPTNSPLSLILGPFDTLGQDFGYGPAWVIPSNFLTNFNLALSRLTRTDLVERYDADGMVRDQIYLGDTLKIEGEEGREYILEDIARIRKFAATAAINSLSAIALIS